MRKFDQSIKSFEELPNTPTITVPDSSAIGKISISNNAQWVSAEYEETTSVYQLRQGAVRLSQQINATNLQFSSDGNSLIMPTLTAVLQLANEEGVKEEAQPADTEPEEEFPVWSMVLVTVTALVVLLGTVAMLCI